MPESKTKPNEDPTGPNLKNFKEFQKAVLSMVRAVPDAALDAAGNDPDAPLIKSNADMVVTIFEKAFTKINSEMKTSSSLAVNDALGFLDVTNGTQFAKQTQQVSVKAFSAKLFGGNIWQWLGQNMTEIKKIIGLLLEFISPKLAAWWKKLSILIDQLFNLILSLLGGVLGLNRRDIARDLSLAEVNHLNEMTAHAKLMQVVGQSDDYDDD